MVRLAKFTQEKKDVLVAKAKKNVDTLQKQHDKAKAALAEIEPALAQAKAIFEYEVNRPILGADVPAEPEPEHQDALQF